MLNRARGSWRKPNSTFWTLECGRISLSKRSDTNSLYGCPKRVQFQWLNLVERRSMQTWTVTRCFECSTVCWRKGRSDSTVITVKMLNSMHWRSTRTSVGRKRIQQSSSLYRISATGGSWRSMAIRTTCWHLRHILVSRTPLSRFRSKTSMANKEHFKIQLRPSTWGWWKVLHILLHWRTPTNYQFVQTLVSTNLNSKLKTKCSMC